jgi:hypothetical protein
MVLWMYELKNCKIISEFHTYLIFQNIYVLKTKFNLAVDEKIQVSRKLLEEFLREFF